MALENGSRFAVSIADVLPQRSSLVPDSTSEAQWQAILDGRALLPVPLDCPPPATGAR
jgi:hypothetical protein